MNARQSNSIDREYLKRCKDSTPEQRLDWLAAAVEFARVPKERRGSESSEKASRR